MKKKDKALAFMLEIINPAFGFTYIDSKNQNYIAVTIIVTIIKLIFYFGMYEAFGLTSKGKFVFVLVSSVIVGLPSALVSLSVVSKLNKKIEEDIKLRLENENKIIRENEIKESSKYSSKALIDDLNKIDNLYKNSLLTYDELNTRKEAIINKIADYGVKEDAEDFLNSILILKENGILSKEEIIEIKNKIFNIKRAYY